MSSSDLPVVSLDLKDSDCDLPALVIGKSSWTYGELGRRADDFLRAIQSHGSGKRILIASEKSFDVYALEIAAFRSGSVFCPLNTAAPVGRNRRICEDFEPDLIFSGLTALSQDELGVSCDELLPLPCKEYGFPKDLDPPEPSGVAYVIYTSGSTGHPKGVQITVESLVWFIAAALQRCGVDRSMRWSNHPNLAFDLSIFDLFGSVASRSCLFPLTEPVDRAFPGGFIQRQGLEFWHSVPSIVQALQTAKAGEAGLLRTLRRVVLCGEPLKKSWVMYLLEHCSDDVRVYNAYGPTETTVFCATEEVTIEYLFDSESTVSIGSPFDGAVFSFRETSDQGIAELVISGPGVGPGYINSAAADTSGYGYTNEGVPCYSTGDLVETVGDRMYFRGRDDHQVKLRGHRFELGEIEAATNEAGVIEACAVEVDGQVVLFLLQE